MRLTKGTLISGLFAISCVWASAQVVSNLERNGSVSWEFYGGQYTITGAINMSGTVGPSGQALVFSFQDLDNDGVALDVRLDIATLFPDLGINYTVNLIGTVISDGPNEAVVQWFASVDPNICATVNISGTEVQAKITHLEGGLRGRVVPVDCQPDPLGALDRYVNLHIQPTGGDDHNYLLAQGYLFCSEQQSFWATARIYDMNWEAYGGGSAGGDVDGNGCVDDADLLAVLFEFGGGASCADVNHDGLIDDADLLTVLFNFGNGC